MNYQKKLIHLFQKVNGISIPLGSTVNEGLESVRTKTPYDKIVEFFNHYKLDVSKLNPEIVRQIFIRWDDIEDSVEGISDHEENPDGTVSIEFDGLYGKHWVKFENQDVWRKYYEDHILADSRYAFEKEYKAQQEQLDKKQQSSDQEIASRNTIGNLLTPDQLNKIRGLKEDGQPPVSLFDMTNVQAFCDRLNTELQVPLVKAGFSTLGGKENVSVLVLVCFDPKDQWPHGILENSHYVRLHIDRNGVIEQFSGGQIKNRFRKTRVKDQDQAIARLNQWIAVERGNSSVQNQLTTEGLDQLGIEQVQEIPDSPFDNQANISVNPQMEPNPNPAIPESIRPTIVKKEVRYLSIGDVLSGSGVKVVSSPVAGLKTPSGKVELVVEYPNGKKYLKTWGKYTVVGIRSSESDEPLPVDPAKLPDEITDNNQSSFGLDSGLGE